MDSNYIVLGFTKNQESILSVILRGNDDATFVDLDQLLDRVNYKVTKQAMQHSLRSLIRRGYIEKSADTVTRRGKARRLLRPTKKAFEDYATYLGPLN